jgi:photosystem II stability/assembly factor-like uncharacterized protein
VSPLPGRCAALVLATGLALAGCASTDTAPPAAPAGGGEPAATARAGSGAVPTVPAAAGHLHGLGLDPGDGTLYLATHSGLMVLEPDGVRRVGSASIDLMGFSVAGPGHLYASGHPGAGSQLPDPVGLVESTDGGRTWTALSLGGASDFHALTAGAGRVYGYDGRIRATDDRHTWTDGADDVRPASLAVHPEQADMLLATTERGPVRSQDGGRSFTRLAAAPLLVHLSWPGPAALWGVGADGAVHLSADGGTTWERRGAVDGAPEALTAAADGTVVVATSAAVLRSDDGGRTFTTLAHKG